MNELKISEKDFINIFGEDKQNAIVLGDIENATQKEKVLFYNEVINCEKKIDDILNKPQKIKYIHIVKQRLSKPENPKGYEEVPRIVFYFENGDAVLSMSVGIYIALKRLFSIFGYPPYDFSITFLQLNKGKNRIYTISINTEE